MSSFASLNVGSLAIHAAQRGLDVTGQNISNSATPGYSRQRVDQVAVGGPTVPAIWSRYDGVGGGVRVTGVSRMRDEFLEARARLAHSNLAETQKLEQTYAGIERTFDEPSKTGLQTKFAEAWQSWATISTNPSDAGPRNLAFENLRAAADQLNHMGLRLETQWRDTVTEAQVNVNDVNTMAKDIANLNRAIRNNTIAGLPSNELADQRDLLVEKVTTLTGGVAEHVEDGQVNVRIGTGPNNYLVRGYENSAIKLTTTGADPRTGGAALAWATTAESTQYGTEFENIGPVAIATGELSGQLKTINTVLPNYLTKLDTIARGFATTVNDQQKLGFTINGDAGADLLGPASGATVTATNIRVLASATSDSLAISSGNPSPAPPAVGVLDGNNALAMSMHIKDEPSATTPAPDAVFRGLVVELGVEAQSVNRAGQAQMVVADDADDARENVSGVSLNEEMTNLVKYQHSFSAAAKFITTVDTTIEALLNMVR